MNDPPLILDHLETALTNPDRGVIGFVDELVTASREQNIQFGWQDGCCYLAIPGCDSPNRIEVATRKAVVRAALARIAVLCNEQRPGSVSPYGGHGEIAMDGDPSRAIRATFVNTPEAASLELTPVSSFLGLSAVESPH